jgi:hypothetical protein
LKRLKFLSTNRRIVPTPLFSPFGTTSNWNSRKATVICGYRTQFDAGQGLLTYAVQNSNKLGRNEK